MCRLATPGIRLGTSNKMYSNNHFKEMLSNLNSSVLNGFSKFEKISRLVEKVKYINVIINKDTNPHPSTFYLLKNSKDRFVGLVLDATVELYWYVNTQYRKKGYLTNALNPDILQDIFKHRSEITISVNEGFIGIKYFRASESVALKCGFKKTFSGDKFHVYALTKKDFYLNNTKCQKKNQPKF